MSAISSMTGFKNLKKLSLANNHLHAFPNLQKLPALAELRLNGNRITSIPSLVTWVNKYCSFFVCNRLFHIVSIFEPANFFFFAAP